MNKHLKRSIAKIRKNLKSLIDVAKTLDENGYPITHLSSTLESHIITVKTLKEVGKTKRDLRKIFTKEENLKFRFTKWSPYGEVVICQWCCHEIRVAIWLKTTVENDPTHKSTDKCKFIKKDTPKKYYLECKLEEAE